MSTLAFHVLIVEKVGWKGGSREARWKVGCGGKKKVNCRLLYPFVGICRCEFRKYDTQSSVRGRCVSGLEIDSEGCSCDVGWDSILV